MATKLNKLSPEQEAQIPIVRDEFLRIGFSTEPADFEAAEQAVRDAYAVANLPPPKIIIRLASPREGAIAAAILKGTRLGDSVRDQVWAQVRAQVWAQVRDQVWAQVGDQVRDQVWAQVGDQVRDQVWAQVWAQVGDQVWAQVRDQVWAQVRDQVWDQVWDQVRDQVWAQVRDQVWDQVRDQVWAQVSTAFYSQHEAGWLAWASYFHKVCGLPGTEKIEPLARIAANCGWVWFFAGAAIITDRPRTLKRDDQNRLHCENGPALEYRDGFAVHAWHGTRIPAEWIEDKSHLTAKIALTWPNIEQRRIAVEIVGWARILRELKAKVIDADGDPQIGTLVEVKLPDLSRPARFCRVTCGTGREFAVGVPPEIDTALAAQAWMQGVQLADFIRPEIRT